MTTFEEAFNRYEFQKKLDQWARFGPLELKEHDSIIKEPEPAPVKQRREFTVKDLYRMPIGHSGDIPRRCQTCENPPTQFATVYSATLTLTYHFCNPCFTEYIQKEVPENHDGPRQRHLTGDNASKSVASGRPDGGTTEIGTDGNGRRKSIPVRTSETTVGNSGSQQKDGGVEASGLFALEEGISAVAELCSAVFSSD